MAFKEKKDAQPSETLALKVHRSEAAAAATKYISWVYFVVFTQKGIVVNMCLKDGATRSVLKYFGLLYILVHAKFAESWTAESLSNELV